MDTASNLFAAEKDRRLYRGVGPDLFQSGPDSFVISRSTAFTYKGRAVPVRQLGEELGVRYVLEGSVLVDAARVRVNAPADRRPAKDQPSQIGPRFVPVPPSLKLCRAARVSSKCNAGSRFCQLGQKIRIIFRENV